MLEGAWRAVEWFSDFLFPSNPVSWRAVMWLFVAAVCTYGAWQAVTLELTPAQRAFRFGMPVLLLALALLPPMGRKRG